MTTQFDQWRARSPYYDESHEAVAQSVRKFMAAEVLPHIDQWEADGELPRAAHKKAAAADKKKETADEDNQQPRHGHGSSEMVRYVCAHRE